MKSDNTLNTINDEQLIAYLDGELEAELCQRIEQRLAEDEAFRQRLQQLDEAWNLLDYLPHAHSDESFTRSTIEMVATVAESDVTHLRVSNRRRQRLLALAGGIGLVAAVMIGYMLVTFLLDGPNRRLVRDLPVIENVDMYHRTESINFLRQLDSERLFPDESEEEVADAI